MACTLGTLVVRHGNDSTLEVFFSSQARYVFHVSGIIASNKPYLQKTKLQCTYVFQLIEVFEAAQRKKS